MLLNLLLLILLNTNNIDNSLITQIGEIEISPIYNEENLLQESYVTTQQLKLITKETGLEGLEKYYIEAEKQTGVNAIYLLSLSAVESAWGTSNIYKEKGNLFGWKAYDKNPNYHAKDFTEYEDSGILNVAINLRVYYLTYDGKYYNGLSIKDVSKRYCPYNSENWCSMINSISNKIIDKNKIKLKELF